VGGGPVTQTPAPVLALGGTPDAVCEVEVQSCWQEDQHSPPVAVAQQDAGDHEQPDADRNYRTPAGDGGGRRTRPPTNARTFGAISRSEAGRAVSLACAWPARSITADVTATVRNSQRLLRADRFSFIPAQTRQRPTRCGLSGSAAGKPLAFRGLIFVDGIDASGRRCRFFVVRFFAFFCGLLFQQARIESLKFRFVFGTHLIIVEPFYLVVDTRQTIFTIVLLAGPSGLPIGHCGLARGVAQADVVEVLVEVLDARKARYHDSACW
jgi:hypothetical protein